jgi:hypothetical protein
MSELSIVKSIKKMLSLEDDYEVFDSDVIIHINTVLSKLTQLGIGPPEGFLVEDEEVEWTAFLGDDARYNMAKSYVYLNVRLLFDPPATSFAIKAWEDQLEELGWRLNTVREEDKWNLLPVVVLVLDE